MHFEGICGRKQELNYPFNNSWSFCRVLDSWYACVPSEM